MPWRAGYWPLMMLARLTAQMEVLTKQLGKISAGVGEAVEVGGVDGLVAGVADGVVALVVGEDEEQIGGCGGERSEEEQESEESGHGRVGVSGRSGIGAGRLREI